ncbi:MAG: diguanylate cyclase [Lysobacterales bacterium]
MQKLQQIAGLFCFMLFSGVAAWAAPALIGTPPTARYVPEVDVIPQNFAIVRDSRGLVYVGNTNGVIEFDGERWALIPTVNREIVRSLAVDANDRVYVGGYNVFGYLDRDEFGQTSYVDLTPRFAKFITNPEFADIWDTLVTPEGVYFRALRQVFLWNPKDGSVRHWRHEGRFGAIALTDAGTMLQFRGEGFRVRRGEDFVPLPGTESLVNLIVGLVPLIDGGYLSFGVDGAWRRLNGDGSVRPLEMPEGMPPSSDFNEAERLDDGSLAFASGDGLLYIVDPQRRGMQRFKLDPGFLSGIHPTGDGGFLVSGNSAIYRVSWPTEWAVLGDEHGAVGSMFGMANWAGAEYLMSSAGAAKLTPRDGAPPLFEVADWSQGLAYGLVEIDAERALLAESHKLILVDRGQRLEIGDGLIYPRSFLSSRFRPGRVYVGTESGLRIVQVNADAVQISGPDLVGKDLGVIELAEVSDQELWLGTRRQGIWRVQLDAGGKVLEQRRHGPEEGLRLGVIGEASLLQLQDGRLLASTHEGFFQWAADRFEPTQLDGLADLRNPEELLSLAQSPQGELWALGVGRLFRQSSAGNWQPQSLGYLRRGAYENVHFGVDGSVIVVASQSLLLFNSAINAERPVRPQVLLRSVTRMLADGVRESLPLHPEQAVHLPYADSGVQFQFALPDLAYPRGRAYQGRLVGYETEFSDWSSAHGYLYSRLSPGAYALEVRARDGSGNITAIEPYRLVIDPPWYRTGWAYLLWLLSFALVMGWSVRSMIRRHTRKLAAETRRLESMIEARTRDLAGANQRLELMANLDGLTGIANRRKLDQFLEQAWRQGRERQERLALLAIDVDHFKRYNDTHGHLAGDQFLRDLMPILGQCLRRNQDLLARYGGEEFVAVLPGADSQTALAVAERMRSEVYSAGLGASISVGVASVVPGPGEVSELIEAADAALYAAKRAGRNRVVLAPGTRA